jgi:hypothetical protein
MNLYGHLGFELTLIGAPLLQSLTVIDLRLAALAENFPSCRRVDPQDSQLAAASGGAFW